MRRNFSTTCTTLGTRGEKLQADAALCGRSMVEMLGVLAIIGVLSVGAISGYSKAMEKYKINKVIQNQSHFIAQLVQYENLKENDGDITPYMQKLNLFPDKYSAIRGTVYTEANGIWFHPFVRSGRFVIDYHLDFGAKKNFNVKLCTSLISSLAVPLHASVWRVWLYRGEDNTNGKFFYGDATCTQTNQCLRNVTQSDIYTLCNECLDGSGCVLALELF